MNRVFRVAFAIGFVTSLGCPREPALVGCEGIALGHRSRPPNVLLIVGDTWRRDVSSTYGGAAATPSLDRLASQGILFERAYSTAPWTKPAMASLFTGLEPSAHGVVTHLDRQGRGDGIIETDVLADDFTTLAELHQDAGYATAAIVANPWLVRPYGFEQGFDVYQDSLAKWDATASDVTLAASLWLASRASDEPWFLYVHYLDPHLPYGPLELERLRSHAHEIEADDRPVDEAALQAIRGQTRLVDGRSALDLGFEPKLRLLELAYEQGVERFDAAVGELLEVLEARPDVRDTAVIVTADHGESLYERGVGNHGTSLHDEEIAIPLVMRLPGATPRPAVSRCATSLAGVMSFICRYGELDCTDVPSPASGLAVFEGVSSAPRRRGVSDGRYKLVWEPEPAEGHPGIQLFDLAADPGERRNIALEAPDVVARLRAELESRPGGGSVRSPKADLPAEQVERLRELGYGN